MPNGGCCVPHCSNRSGHLFPKDTDRRKRWLVAIRRDKFEPTPHSIVCRKHFVESDYHQSQHTQEGSKRVRKFLKKDAVPSVFQWTKIATECQSRRTLRQFERVKGEQTSLAKQWADQAAEKQIQKDTDREQRRIFTELEIPICEDTTVETMCGSIEPELIDVDVPLAESCELNGNEFDIIADDHLADVRIDPNVGVNSSSTCKHDEMNELPYVCVDRIQMSDTLVQFYTGLDTFDVFMHAFWSLGENVNHLNYAYSESCHVLTPLNQFLLMLVKLRRHYTHFELARMFKVSEFTVQNVFVTWINFCYFQWKEVDWWPQRDLVSYHCPIDFKKKFPSTRVIVDATEVHVKHPSNPRAQKASFSSYKHSNTMKVLIGVTPGGLTSFVSDAYGGSASDRQVVERSALTTLCAPSDSIMADKGFNVQDIFAVRDVTINIPAFFKNKNRLSPATRHNDRKIASKRVHVERVIGMAKVFRICHSRLGVLETKLATQIITVCFYLCNFRKTIVSRFA